MQFIHCFGNVPNNNSNLDLLEEIRGIGFENVIQTNDEFNRFKLKLNSNETMSLRIFKDHLEYSLDSFNDFPVKKVFDKKKGFLKRSIKAGENYLKELEEISLIVFDKIDENFNTLRPERFDKKSFKRRIYCKGGEEISIFYDFESKEIIMNNFKYSMEQGDKIFKDLHDHVGEEEDEEETGKECGICYSIYLDGQLTNLSCSDSSVSSCNQIYHETCLRELFKANPTSRTIFDKIVGNGLFCETVKLNRLGIYSINI